MSLMKPDRHFPNEEEILEIIDGYVSETPDGNDHEVLRKWLAAHPTFERDLLEFAFRRDVLANSPEEEFESAEAKSAYLEKSRALYRQFAAEPTPFEGFMKRLESLQIKKQEFIDSMGISPAILNSLENCSIDSDTIPASFLRKMALKLQVAAESLSAYLQQPAMAAQFHKNHRRPDEAQKISFSDAVDADLNMTADQKKSLLD